MSLKKQRGWNQPDDHITADNLPIVGPVAVSVLEMVWKVIDTMVILY